MDTVRPLPCSRSGNRYVLVMCDYGTRYPGAVPLHTIDAERVAEELMLIFSRVGIPRKILTDQGTNFQSQLLPELYVLRTSTHRQMSCCSVLIRRSRACSERQRLRRAKIGTVSSPSCCLHTEKSLRNPLDSPHLSSYMVGMCADL